MGSKAHRYAFNPSTPVASGRYVHGPMLTSTTTSGTTGHKVFRAMYLDMGRQLFVDQVWNYMSTGGTAGSGSGDGAFRIYPCGNDNGPPPVGTQPIVAVGGVAMTGAAADKTWTLSASGILLPARFWAGFVHDCQGGNPTVLCASGTATLRGGAVSDTTVPATTPTTWMGLQWTESSYAVSATWGNATVSNTSAVPVFAYRMK